MAIEIIKEGKIRNPKYQGTCNHCKCVFSFQEEDVMLQESWRNETYVKIRCPYCKQICTINIDRAKIIEE